jgi:hypothetical protein
MTAANPHTLPNRITNPCFSMKNIPWQAKIPPLYSEPSKAISYHPSSSILIHPHLNSDTVIKTTVEILETEKALNISWSRPQAGRNAKKQRSPHA